ncbi:crotonase/enoyl-CoA hydratase family protein [Hyphococcus sp.]|uniref:crotonase/enoyl-CoA hydratase family protein n=1 Tax=Hyphococcus sp. TaxID=2038636 RepID=UPI00208D4323|nr:MAG: enoyl-CoA hydratase [Marinicaulis sp.]
MSVEKSVLTEINGPVLTVTINRPERRNAVDSKTAALLYETFKSFDENDALAVAVLTGVSDNFCAGADLKALAEGDQRDLSVDKATVDSPGPMGPTRMRLSKPVIAAVEGFAVAGGIELALWCDMRVAAEGATFGVYCRRFGVPLIDLGSIRLPRLIGHSRATDMILTGRAVEAKEAFDIGLANRLAPRGQALAHAQNLAQEIATLPQRCLRNDRLSSIEQWDLSEEDAMQNEMRRGLSTISSGETASGAAAFSGGAGRSGQKR